MGALSDNKMSDSAPFFAGSVVKPTKISPTTHCQRGVNQPVVRRGEALIPPLQKGRLRGILGRKILVTDS